MLLLCGIGHTLASERAVSEKVEFPADASRYQHLDFHLVEKAKQSIAPDVAAGKKVVIGYKAFRAGDAHGGVDGYYLLSRSPQTRCYVLKAWAAIGSSGDWSVMVDLDKIGSDRLDQVTGQKVGKRLAIVFDDVVVASLPVGGKITGTFEIRGSFSELEARALVKALSRDPTKKR